MYNDGSLLYHFVIILLQPLYINMNKCIKTCVLLKDASVHTLYEGGQDTFDYIQKSICTLVTWMEVCCSFLFAVSQVYSCK